MFTQINSLLIPGYEISDYHFNQGESTVSALMNTGKYECWQLASLPVKKDDNAEFQMTLEKAEMRAIVSDFTHCWA